MNFRRIPERGDRHEPVRPETHGGSTWRGSTAEPLDGLEKVLLTAPMVWCFLRWNPNWTACVQTRVLLPYSKNLISSLDASCCRVRTWTGAKKPVSQLLNDPEGLRAA
jgi:hypothetical protein